MAVSQLQASEFARLLALELTTNGWDDNDSITVDMLAAIGRRRPIALTDDEVALMDSLQQALDDWRK